MGRITYKSDLKKLVLWGTLAVAATGMRTCAVNEYEQAHEHAHFYTYTYSERQDADRETEQKSKDLVNATLLLIAVGTPAGYYALRSLRGREERKW